MRNDVLQQLAKDPKIRDACKKINYNSHEDLFQELFIILCELPEEKLEQIYKDGYLYFWCVRTLVNMTSKNGKFYIKYKITNEETEGEKRLAEEPDEEREQLLDIESKRTKIEDLLEQYERKGRDSFGWYKVNLLKMYVEVGTYRKLSAITGIATRTICNDINTFRKELLSNLTTSPD